MSAPKASAPSLPYLLLIILAGESVFLLPFVLIRVFRPTVLSVYGIDNTDVGVCFAVYGFVALGSYLFGGPLADRFPARKLMGTALLLTAAGGLVYANAPSLQTLKLLYGYWGFTTIFLFWAAMIKATRVWGGPANQGRAFGFLDGGRGLVGATVSLGGLFIFEAVMGEAGEASNNVAAFRRVVLSCSAFVAVVGVLVLLFLRSERERNVLVDKIRWADVSTVLRLPTVWLLMVIILCAYTGYRVTDIFSLYAADVMGYDEVGSAGMGTFLLFLRPVVGVAAGLLADRNRPSLYLIIGFLCLLLGAVFFLPGSLATSGVVGFYFTVVLTAIGVYAARVLYFAVLQEGRIPVALTGTAVGLISFVGYTPDIFANLLFGYFLDKYPGAAGHTYVFICLIVFAVIGLAASGAFSWLAGRSGTDEAGARV